MTTKTIQELLNSEAYILENPETGLLSLGSLSKTATKTGRFVDYNHESTVYLSEPDYQLSRSDLALELKKFSIKKSEGFNWSISSNVPYKNSFQSAQDSFKNSNLEKVILYKEASAHINDSLGTFFKILVNLLSIKSKGYVYGLINPLNDRYVVGLAPEFLFKQSSSGSIETVAVAGTGSLDESLLSNQKLLTEQKVVELDISSSLGQNVTWKEVGEEVHHSLKHLVSHGIVEGIKAENLSDKLHPTSAVGYMPKNVNLSFMPGPEPRGFYGGFAELLMSEASSAFSLVLIRGVEISKSKLKMRFGGGVIQESDLENELAELDLKFNNLKNLCGL